MITGCVFGLIASLISFIKFKKILKKCLVVDNNECLDTFEYKGKIYNREKFIELEVNQLKSGNLKKSDLVKSLNDCEAELPKSKTPDLDKALIEAYKKVISTM